jgi:putative DNA primase/helicase
VKVATGSDPITARYLYRENFTYIPQFKIWLAMNSKPTIKGTDDGIWRRIRLIPYTVSFQDTADQTLEQQLRAEHSGILAWAVRGAIDWFDRGLQPPQKVLDATAEYRTESDHIARFLDDCVVVDGNEKIKASALYNRYGRWCDVYNEKPINNTAFGLRMVAEGYEKQKAKYVFYMGIKLNGR